MLLTRRTMIIGVVTGMGAAVLGIPCVRGADWHEQFPVLNFGVVSGENEADRITRHKPFVAYMERTLRVNLKMHQATDYAGTTEALKARKLEFARFGPASYAKAWLVMR